MKFLLRLLYQQDTISNFSTDHGLFSINYLVKTSN